MFRDVSVLLIHHFTFIRQRVYTKQTSSSLLTVFSSSSISRNLDSRWHFSPSFSLSLCQTIYTIRNKQILRQNTSTTTSVIKRINKTRKNTAMPVARLMKHSVQCVQHLSKETWQFTCKPDPVLTRVFDWYHWYRWRASYDCRSEVRFFHGARDVVSLMRGRLCEFARKERLGSVPRLSGHQKNKRDDHRWRRDSAADSRGVVEREEGG